MDKFRNLRDAILGAMDEAPAAAPHAPEQRVAPFVGAVQTSPYFHFHFSGPVTVINLVEPREKAPPPIRTIEATPKEEKNDAPLRKAKSGWASIE